MKFSPKYPAMLINVASFDRADGTTVEYPRHMHHTQVYQALGLDPKKHLPEEGLPPQVINGVTVWVEPKKPTIYREYLGRQIATRNQPHRVKALCPTCGKTFTAGKLFMHQKVHNDG